MDLLEMLKSIGNQLQSGATVRNVFGEPISAADRTVIPVARVSYGFGGGSGPGGETRKGDHGGGGGGGHVSAAPVGIVEITTSGTRFIAVRDWRKTISLVALSLGLGFIAGRRHLRGLHH